MVAVTPDLMKYWDGWEEVAHHAWKLKHREFEI